MSLYLVTDNEAPKGAKARFIKANSAAAAVRHVTGTRFTAEVVSNAEKAADLIVSGYTMETAGEEPAPETETKQEGTETKDGDLSPPPASSSKDGEAKVKA